MAHISYIVTDKSNGAVSSFEAPLPEHDEGDTICIGVGQDGGSGTISISGFSAIGSQAASSACRMAWFRKVSGASESPPVVSSTISDQMVVVVMTIKDVDPTTPINFVYRTDWSGNSAQNPGTGQSTDAANCLLIYSWLSDTPGASNKMVTELDDILIDATEYNELTLVVGHKQQHSAGSVPQITAYCDESGEGGSAFVIAINTVSGGSKATDIAGGPKKLAWYGGLSTQHESLTWTALSGMVSTIGGVTVNATGWAAYVNWAKNDIELEGGYWNNSIADPGEWVGMYHAVPTALKNMSGKLFGVHWAPYGPWGTGSVIGVDGLIVVFKDGSGNWAAFHLGVYPRPDFYAANTNTSTTDFFVSVLAVSSLTPFSSSGTMDWTDVVSIGYGYKRKGSSTNSRGFTVGHAYIYDNPVLTGGSAAAPCTPVTAAKAYQGIYYRTQIDYVSAPSSVQGYGQVVTKGGYQVGDGSTPTYFSAKATSHEFPRKYSPLSKARLSWREAANCASVIVYASDSDVVDFGSYISASDTKQKFEIHTSSSLLAAYNFAGWSVSGYEIFWKAGVTCNDAIFDQCYQITANGGTFDGCVIRSGLDAIALTTTDLSEIKNCKFISSGSGHAAEITVPGTYAYEGNTHTNYGANDTTDAAIYNNSGSAVIINVSGGDTPTVRNGAGASTTVNNSVSITFDGVVAGSEIRVYNSSEAEIAGVETCTADQVLSFTTNIGEQVRVIIVNFDYVTEEFSYTLPSVDSAIPINQLIDLWANNP